MVANGFWQLTSGDMRLQRLVFLECGQRGEQPSCRSTSSFADTSALRRRCYGSVVTEGDERFDHWVPAPGQIVRVKPGFKGSIEERAFKRASEEGGPKLKLDGKTLYEVVKCEKDKDHRALHLQEVNIIYVAGERFVAKGNKVPYPLSIELFQLAREHNIAGEPRPGL